MATSSGGDGARGVDGSGDGAHSGGDGGGSASGQKWQRSQCGVIGPHTDGGCDLDPESAAADKAVLSPEPCTEEAAKAVADAASQNGPEDVLPFAPSSARSAIVDKAKRQFGLEVPRMMAWRAKKKAKDIVLGDHKKQYRRLRDYLETVKLTNPGSRCIVITVSGKTRENPTAGPRFHGLFFSLNACCEGFLNGCRPFIGLDGCFIKLTSGAQILAATGRDANNNMYPIAFGVVGVEDTPNWSWFLTQLKYALGGSEEGKFGKYTFMSDRQKVLGMVGPTPKTCGYFLNLHKATGHPVLVFMAAGRFAQDVEKLSDKEAVELVMCHLRKMIPDATEPRQYLVSRWGSDPNSLGSYSCDLVGKPSDVCERFSAPVESVLYFAGEAASAEHSGAVHGAYSSGMDAAEECRRRLLMRKGVPDLVQVGAACEEMADVVAPLQICRT